MFNLSWSETAVVLTLAILIINPKDLPTIMKGVGKAIGKVKRLGKTFMMEIENVAGEEHIKEFREQLDKEQALIGKMIDMDGNPQDVYEVPEEEKRPKGDKGE